MGNGNIWYHANISRFSIFTRFKLTMEILCNIDSKLIIPSPERCNSRRSAVFIARTNPTQYSDVSFAEPEQADATWEERGRNENLLHDKYKSIFMVLKEELVHTK